MFHQTLNVVSAQPLILSVLHHSTCVQNEAQTDCSIVVTYLFWNDHVVIREDQKKAVWEIILSITNLTGK